MSAGIVAVGGASCAAAVIGVGEDDPGTDVVVAERQCRWALRFHLVGVNHVLSGSSAGRSGDGDRSSHDRQQ
ncbi:unnamed protein product [Triticum turgidum subsp. durum]|nr:unnamed protein product [Triticum turgidum subsp. durum]